MAIVKTNIEDKGLKRAAKKALKDNRIQKEMLHLEDELKKDNLSAGIGLGSLGNGTGISYLKGRNGARLFFRKLKEKPDIIYEIVAKARGTQHKREEDYVINRLIEMFGN